MTIRSTGRGPGLLTLLLLVSLGLFPASRSAAQALPPPADAVEITLDTPALTGAPAAVRGARALSAGTYHTCAVSQRGNVWCWGLNHRGQLGDGTNTERRVPTRVAGLSGGFVAVAAGYEHSCALSTSGQIYCWGANTYGQLGDGTQIQRLRPVQVRGLTGGATALSLSVYHSCAITTRARAVCWGLNETGQLGDGSYSNRLRPVSVVGLRGDVATLSTAPEHGCALNTAGQVACWGRNEYGQLGDGTTTNRPSATPVTALGNGNLDVSTGSVHSCAVTRRGRVACWGANGSGQLGDGTSSPSLLPVLARTPLGMTAVTAGGSYYGRIGSTCALNRHQRLFCWGLNGRGQLGIGSFEDSWEPRPVLRLSGGLRTVTLSPAGAHSCAMNDRGRLFCWGYNGNGQLGDGATNDATAPVDVLGRLHIR